MRLVRTGVDVGNVVMDVNGVENGIVVALGGADTVTVNDLSRTGVANVNIDPAASVRRRDPRSRASRYCDR